MTLTEFAALTDAQREKLRDNCREHATEWGWWDDVYDQFVEKMGGMGVLVIKDDIHFSGFWSQGDGACFAGQVRNWHKFLTATGHLELAGFYQTLPPAIHLRWDTAGSRYCHEGCMQLSRLSDLWLDNPYDEESDPVRYTAWKHTQPEGGPFYSLEKEFLEFLRDQARQLYRDLEAEYEYLTSDEAIDEYILANVDLETI